MTIPYAPQIVAKQSFIAQTTLIPETVLFTATETGDYQVSIYPTQSPSTPGDGPTVVGYASWADQYGEATNWFFETDPGPGGTPVFSVHLPEGNSIYIETTSGGSSEYPYDIFVTVTQY